MANVFKVTPVPDVSVGTVASLAGDRELIAALRSMRAASARKIMRPAISAALTIASKTAKANAPKRTGKLKKAIKKKVKKARKGGITGYLYISRSQDTDKVKPSVYGRYIEFGTRSRNPNPFLRSAVGGNKAAMLQKIQSKARERFLIEARKAAIKGKAL